MRARLHHCGASFDRTACPPDTLTIEVIIYDVQPLADLVKKRKIVAPDREVKVFPQDKLRKLGKGKLKHEEHGPGVDYIAWIMYMWVHPRTLCFPRQTSFLP